MEFGLSVFGIEGKISIRKKKQKKIDRPKRTITSYDQLSNVKLNLGPGPNWDKPSEDWYTIDIDPSLGDVVVDFQKFDHLPFNDGSAICAYGSHVFEHISIFKSQLIFDEIHRVLKEGGIFRLVLPDAEKSIREYVKGNQDFLLFKRRKKRAKDRYGKDYTLFECMKEDFLSVSGQADLLGNDSLAHQNAWDFETIKTDLIRAGFSPEKIKRMNFKETQSEFFSFEGEFPSEANEDYRSLYVEAIK